MTDLVLGIDTGGTFTDGVLLDYRARQLVKTIKTLTTCHDLSICILTALDALIPDDPERVRLVSISTPSSELPRPLSTLRCFPS